MNAVIKLNITPLRKAVDIPENVPRNRIGRPKVNNMSQKTWVLHMNLTENILHNIIRYPMAAIMLMTMTSMMFYSCKFSAYLGVLGI